MTPKEGSRFDGLFGAVKSAKTTTNESVAPPDGRESNLDVQTPKHSDVQTSKSKDPNYQRTTIYIPKPMHRKLKAIAAEEEKEISAIVEDLVQQWLNSKKNQV